VAARRRVVYPLLAMQRPPTLSRRHLLTGSAAALATLTQGATSHARGNHAAAVPQGFVPWSNPGKVVKVSKANTLVENGLWPKQEAADQMLERVMAELTGKSDLAEAFKLFVHPSDIVAIKPNGIAGKRGATMASNKELVLGIVRGLVAAGVPASNIIIYEQFKDFLAGTRVVDKEQKIDPEFPAGVRTMVHLNEDAVMDEIKVASIGTKYVRAFTEATCVINVSQIKDHSICGYTGAMKNITHGSIINPHAFHEHNASPQIAQLYAQDVVKSRVRLHITDAFKLIYDQGPLDKNPKRRIPHEALYASTDPVALDVVGWQLVEHHRKENGLDTLKMAGREPTYIKAAADLGLGTFDSNKIRLRDVKI
jgi:uncharacterized protein (DUF362 family)